MNVGATAMSTVVLLRDVIDGIEVQSDESGSYLNRRTGEVYWLTGEESGHAGENLLEGEEEFEELPAWQQEAQAKAREVLNSDDWLPLPSQFDVHEWSIMQDFSHSVEDETLREELLNAIHGSGAFRHFKDVLRRRGIQNRWYEFNSAAIEEIAIAWLEANGIEYTREMPQSSGSQALPDNRNANRR
jgi:hypothetical protein